MTWRKTKPRPPFIWKDLDRKGGHVHFVPVEVSGRSYPVGARFRKAARNGEV